jgi:hypothetical protein
MVMDHPSIGVHTASFATLSWFDIFRLVLLVCSEGPLCRGEEEFLCSGRAADRARGLWARRGGGVPLLKKISIGPLPIPPGKPVEGGVGGPIPVRVWAVFWLGRSAQTLLPAEPSS